MRFRFAKALVSAVFLSGAIPALADSLSFEKQKEEGYFWYKDPPPKTKKTPPPVAAPVPAPTPPTSTPFSVEWLRKAMPKLLDEAIDSPTPERVSAYLYAQRIAMDKSQNYAEMARTVVATDPLLDENNRLPLATYTKPFFLRGELAGKKEVLKYLASIGGFWLFFDSKCSFCRPMANTVQAVSSEYGFVMKNISMDGKSLPNIPTFVRDNGHARLLELKVYPTVIFAVPPRTYLVLSQGMMAQDQLTDRLLVAAESRGLIPATMLAKYKFYDRGVLTPADTASGASDDPAAWVRILKERLHGRYPEGSL